MKNELIIIGGAVLLYAWSQHKKSGVVATKSNGFVADGYTAPDPSGAPDTFPGVRPGQNVPQGSQSVTLGTDSNGATSPAPSPVDADEGNGTKMTIQPVERFDFNHSF